MTGTPDENLSPFERIRQIDPEGDEFWSARDLMRHLEYDRWKTFKRVLARAQTACKHSGDDISEHFMRAWKIIRLGKYAKREVEDVHLSRTACYLIVQNATPKKKAVALAQTYIYFQTRRRELAEQKRKSKGKALAVGG